MTANYLFVYHGATTPATPEDSQKAMAAWGAWFQRIGASVVDGGNPVGRSKTVSAKGVKNSGGAKPVSGYTIVSAESIDAACDMAKGCPIVVDGTGSIQVAEILPM